MCSFTLNRVIHFKHATNFTLTSVATSSSFTEFPEEENKVAELLKVTKMKVMLLLVLLLLVAYRPYTSKHAYCASVLLNR